MKQIVQFQFDDKMVSFDTLMNAIRIVMQEEICKAIGKPTFMVQAKAYKAYGRRNVERWVKEGKVIDHPKGKDGKITRHEYRISELDACKNMIQGYL